MVTNPERGLRAVDLVADERERVADDRDRLADQREREADHREQVADDRDRDAETRDRIANEREQIADDREMLADQREDASDAREAEQDERDSRADESAPASPRSTEDRERGHEAAIERGLARQAAIAARIERNEALVRRVKAEGDRRRADHARSIAALERAGIRLTPRSGHAPPPEMLQEMRQRLISTALGLAAIEDTICRGHEELASAQPDRATHHRYIADQAKAGAERARAIAVKFSD